LAAPFDFACRAFDDAFVALSVFAGGATTLLAVLLDSTLLPG
jgi:hypothetical protein